MSDLTASRRSKPVIAIAIILFAILVYRVVLAPGQVLFTTDDNIGALAMRKASLPQAFFGGWDDSIALGQPVFTHLTWTNILLYLLPLEFFTDWIHAIDLIVGSLALAGWLRLRGRSRSASLLGAFTAYWVGSTFFLTYAGHIGKFGVVLFAGVYLYFVERALRARSIRWALAAGGAMGSMFLEQADVALFFAIPLGLYAVWGVHRDRLTLITHARVAFPVALVAGLIAFHPVWMARSLFSLEKAESNPAITAEQESQANWEYCTQWSWPPDETIDFVVPGYMGWRSGDAKGPYWGRMGRSAGWEQTRQGFQNFRLETLYIGLIPVWAALIGLTLAMRRGSQERGDLVFWSIVTLLTFLLALGKYFPLYRLFYELPGMSSIRNPVKFMQVFQFGLAFLAAYGLDALRRAAEGLAQPITTKVARTATWAVGGVGILFAIWSMSLSGDLAKVTSRFAAEGWGSYAQVIASNMIGGLSQAALIGILACAAGFVIVRSQSPVLRARVVAGLLGVAAVDQLVVSRLYVQSMRAEGFFAANALTRALKDQGDHQRTYLLTQQSFYNLWLTYLFPYHQIPSLNITQMRMPEDYKQFFAALQPNPLRLWQLAAVGSLVGPREFAAQLMQTPGAAASFQPVFAFDVAGSQDGGVIVRQNPNPMAAEHVVLAHKAPSARYQLIGAWQVTDGPTALSVLARPDRDPFAITLVEDVDGTGLESRAEPPGACGTVRVRSYTPARIVLEVRAERESMLRVAEKYEHGWQCRINGQSAPVYRCDFICMAARVPAGDHTIEWVYRPPFDSLYAQLTGWALALLGGFSLLLPTRRKNAIADPAKS